jgi:hypothetical protein
MRLLGGAFAILLFALALTLFRASVRRRKARARLPLWFGMYLAGCLAFLAGAGAILVAITH